MSGGLNVSEDLSEEDLRRLKSEEESEQGEMRLVESGSGDTIDAEIDRQVVELRNEYKEISYEKRLLKVKCTPDSGIMEDTRRWLDKMAEMESSESEGDYESAKEEIGEEDSRRNKERAKDEEEERKWKFIMETEDWEVTPYGTTWYKNGDEMRIKGLESMEDDSTIGNEVEVETVDEDVKRPQIHSQTFCIARAAITKSYDTTSVRCNGLYLVLKLFQDR